MKVKGKIQQIQEKGVLKEGADLDARRNDAENNGIVRGSVVWLDMVAMDERGELDSERIISEGLAYNTVLGLRDQAGNVVAVITGNGPDPEGDRFPAGHPAEGKMIPAPDYKIDAVEGVGVGISPWEHSNGLRNRFHLGIEGYFYPFGSINGMPADFGNDSVRVGAARKRPDRGHQG